MRKLTNPPAKLQRAHKHFPIVLILLMSFVLNITGIDWGLPNYVDWAIDTTVPFDMLEAAYYRFSGGWANIYPPLHYALQAALSTPLMAYVVVSGGLNDPNPIFPFGFSDPLSTLTHIIIIARLLSVAMGVGIVLLVYLTVHELFDWRSALFSALIVTLYYPLIYYAHNANTDVPYLFWSLLAIYYFVRLLKEGLLKHYVLFAMFGTLAICTKDQAYGLFLLSPLPILWLRFMQTARVNQQPPSLWRVLCDQRFLIAGLVAIGTFVLAQNLLLNWSGFLNHVRLITGPGSAPYAAYPPSLSGRLQLLSATLSELARGLTPPIFAFCLLGSVYCAFKFPRYSLPPLFLAVSYYLTFINIVRYVPLRFVLPIGIIMALFGGKFLAEVWQNGAWKKVRRVAIAGVFAYAGLFAIQLDLLFLNDPRYAAEQWLRVTLKEDAIIETFAPSDTFFKHYPRLPNWVKVRSSKIEAGTDWEVRKIRADRKTLPNLYTGREDPDYVILTKYWYRRFMTPAAENSQQARVLKDFFEGRTEYALVASFETPSFVPVSGLPINSRIDIFAKPK